MASNYAWVLTKTDQNAERIFLEQGQTASWTDDVKKARQWARLWEANDAAKLVGGYVLPLDVAMELALIP